MKKYPCILLITTVILMWCSWNVQAVGTLSAVISAEDNIKPGRAFTVTLDLYGSTEIGAAQAVLQYNGDSLTIRSVTLEGKTREDVFQYNDNGNELTFVFSAALYPEKHRTVSIRFVPRAYYSSTNYTFSLSQCLACDTEETWMNITELPVLSQTVEQEEYVSHQESKAAVSQKSSESVHQSEEVSSEKENKTIVADRIEETISVDSADTADNGESSGQIIIIKDSNDAYPLTQTIFLCLLGSVIVVSLMGYIFFRLGKKQGKEERPPKL